MKATISVLSMLIYSVHSQYGSGVAFSSFVANFDDQEAIVICAKLSHRTEMKEKSIRVIELAHVRGMSEYDEINRFIGWVIGICYDTATQACTEEKNAIVSVLGTPEVIDIGIVNKFFDIDTALSMIESGSTTHDLHNTIQNTIEMIAKQASSDKSVYATVGNDAPVRDTIHIDERPRAIQAYRRQMGAFFGRIYNRVMANFKIIAVVTVLIALSSCIYACFVDVDDEQSEAKSLEESCTANGAIRGSESNKKMVKEKSSISRHTKKVQK